MLRLRAKLHNESFNPLALFGVGVVLWILIYRGLLPFWNFLIYTVFSFDSASRLGSGIHFFFYDSTKILLLLGGMIFVVSLIRSFFSVERTRSLLGRWPAGVGNLLAASLGIVTPFCSCSAVPAFIGFVSSGIPLGVTLSFLIASPLINEVAVILLYGLFGLKISALYVMSGLVIASVSGFIIGRLSLERYVESFVFTTAMGKNALPEDRLSWSQRIDFAKEEVYSIIKRIWPYLLVGIGLGAVLHGWVPTDFFERYAGSKSLWSVLAAVLMGVPLYSNAAGILPLIDVLFQKGVPIGTLLAFMMSVVALSLPEMILLKRILKPQLIAIFVSVVAVGIVLTGLLFNSIL